MSAILDQLAPRYDSIVEKIYRAGSGLKPWLDPISEIAEIFQAWSVQLLGVNKRTGVMSFSYESGSGPPAAAVEYIRYYHRVDPRLAKHLPAPVGQWFSCEEHFDDEFVENNEFYRDYLVPFGGRYLYGRKLHDDTSSTVLIGHLSRVGNPPLSAPEKKAFARLTEHFEKALDIEQALADKADKLSVGAELLEKLRQPIILIDAHRRISYRNRNAVQLLSRRDVVFEQDGQLICRDSDSDVEFTIALRAMSLVPVSTHGDVDSPVDRRTLRLVRKDGRQVAGTLLALRPEQTMGTFGRASQALFTVFEPGAAIDIDPFILSTTFDLTPAEARIAALVVNGRTPEECANEMHVKISTVRSQLMAVYAKTGASGQADLVRMVLSSTLL